jgi:hypothetical protein
LDTVVGAERTNLCGGVAAGESRFDVVGVAASCTPLILVTEQGVPQFLLDETNYLRATVPPGRAVDVYAFVGAPSGFLAGQPSLNRAADLARVAVDSWERIRPLLDDSPLVVILEAFDPAAYVETLETTHGRRPRTAS